MWLFDRIRSAVKNIVSAVRGVASWFTSSSKKHAEDEAREAESARMIAIYLQRLALKRQQKITVLPSTVLASGSGYTSTPAVEQLPEYHHPILQRYPNCATSPRWAQTAHRLHSRGEIRTREQLIETLESLRFLHDAKQTPRCAA